MTVAQHVPAEPPAPSAPREPYEPYEPYEPFDAAYTADLVHRVLGPVREAWFRPRIIGHDRIPRHGPVILAANHSGTAFPYDAIVLDTELWRADGLRAERKMRTVFEKELALAWWMRPFGIDNLWRRGGGVDMTFDNLHRLLARGERVLYFPEGVPGIGKGFFRRYRLQRFHASFLLLAARHGAPIVPIHSVNSEWVIPFHGTFPPIDRLLQRFFHVPFLPLPLGVVAALWPWLWYLALPARMTFVVGDPIDARAVLRAEGIDDLERPERAGLDRAARRVRLHAQAALDRHVADHGDRPYDWRSLLPALWRSRRRLLAAIPLGWPVTFVRHARDRERPPARNRLHALVRDLDLLAFFLPVVGWPILQLARRLRRPPCGYRGLTRAERREREGTFIWRLAERPLPPRPPAPDDRRSWATPAPSRATVLR